MDDVIEKKVMGKIFWRLIPLLMFLYVLAYIDRINVGFASLTMNQDLGLSAYIYGWGAGIFFLGYCLLEVPSNLMLAKVGARRWIARILFTWGTLSTCMALVQGPNSFLVMRFLLGAAEAGFFPGVVLYLTYWFPARYRARIISAFMLSIPVSIAIGAPLSTWILHLDGWHGLHGWQWLFIIEGLPAVFATFLVLRFLTDRPAVAGWLTQEEKDWLEGQLANDREIAGATKQSTSLRSVFTSPPILALAFVYFGATGANIGLSFFLPQIIKTQGYSNMEVGFLTSLPYIVGCIGMLVIGYWSDRTKERRLFLIGTMLIAATGLYLAGAFGASFWSIAALAFAAIGILGSKGPFWPLPSAYLSGTAMAGGIAFINTVGNIGGFVGPYAIGWIKDSTGSFEGGLYALAGLAMSAAVVTMLFVRGKGPQAIAIKPIASADVEVAKS
ncbi:MFS transporter [Pseudoduganella umbonata]|uniref:MFS transporter n=1 Tax=Pseudoduganella umbonata TaxID=864828 RepID=A0A4P8HLT7_9BURK|nr:MFS transporter [Pseudoduganella umbonata]MBB3224993.1 ACS family tartrate transporter-like MFS transporter [Pseudoduganella umbonata]QCP09260.1 MFS transporter [Pseudoduganella umbonata]